MARKSNKTAHVLNLLAGHDAAKEADEQAIAEQKTSGDTAAQAAQINSGNAVPTAPDEAEGQAISSGTGAVSGNTSQPAAVAPVSASPPAPAAPPQNNIAMIDKTEEDPVAELIQQKLSSEFEKQIQQARSEAPTPAIEEPAVPITEEPATSAVVETAPPVIEEPVTPAVVETAPPVIEEPVTPVVAEPTIPVESKPVAPAGSTPISPAAEVVPTDVSTDNPNPAPVADTVPVQQAAPAPQIADAPAAPESIPAPEPEPEPEPEEDFAAINVMEHIVNDKIIYYMRQFEVCTCSRCKADVIALTLNGLMPKYIVTMKAAVDPLLSYYTNRLISDVTVEATKACMIVKENPRH